jgi:potassium efflux system protein
VAAIISSSPHLSLFSKSISTGLGSVAILLLILSLFKTMCRPNGIFTKHFSWSELARERLNRTFNWFNWVICLGSFFFVIAITSGLSQLRYGLALISFMISGIAIAVFIFQFFKPKGGIAVAIFANRTRPVIVTLIWPLLVMTPLVTGLLPVFGFFDTAIELQSRVFQSGIVLFFVAVTYGIFMRFYRVAYRRYKLRQLLIQRSKLMTERENSHEVLESGEAIPGRSDANSLNDDLINLQTRKTFHLLAGLGLIIGLWMIWSPLFPALGIAEDIILWQSSTEIGGVEVLRSVTLWNLIVAILWIIGGFVAARNIRGLLEIGVFERMKLNNGERYASITIIGYFLIGFGLVFGLAQLGINWSKLQWIVAALGVGLGFGLQEIVANFISGIIILFERPIRVGDTVTIGDLSGTVRNIKIRATTITDFDNRDVLLPNKSIITENVTNWTLNDAVTRVVIPIGVAYGSDIEQVRNLLLEIVTNHPDVLTTPPPTVFFLAHGDSSLDFNVRVFVETPIKRLPVTHEINAKINAVLKDNGIDIPFPQRTLHIIDTKDREK